MQRKLGHCADRRKLIQGLSLMAVMTASHLRRAFSSTAKSSSSASALHFFTPHEAAQLDLLGDALVPGARAAGLAHYIDRYVNVAPADTLLTVRYLNISPPYGNFYRDALQRLGTYRDTEEAIHRLANTQPVFYFALRSDALDVTYGTMAGFATLDIPYLPHIAPREPW